MGKGGCIICHSGPFFTDFAFHNMSREAVSPDGTRADEGRFLITGVEADRGAFLTPTLRSVVMTSPFFHDGSEVNLRRVIAHITGPDGKKDPLHSPILDGLSLLNDADTDALISFLKALTGTMPSPARFNVPLEDLPSLDHAPVGAPL